MKLLFVLACFFTLISCSKNGASNSTNQSMIKNDLQVLNQEIKGLKEELSESSRGFTQDELAQLKQEGVLGEEEYHELLQLAEL
jgi:phage tail tape-measure protein